MRKIYLIAALAIFTACQHRLVPTWFNADKDRSPLSEITANDVTVRLENLELNHGYMVFDLEVVNTSDYPVQFDFRDVMSYSSLNTFEDASGAAWMKKGDLQVVSALSYAEVNDLYEKKLKKGKTMGILMAVAAVGLVAYDIAADARDYSASEWTAADARKSVTRDAITASTLLALDIASGANEASYYKTVENLHYLPDEIFRTSVIAGGDSYRGKVYLKNDLLNKYYRINVPVEGTSYVFDFKRANSRERQRINP